MSTQDRASEPVVFRPAVVADVPTLLALIGELAEYENLGQEMSATAASLCRWLFGPEAVAEARVAEVDGAVVGMAIFYRNFSTFVGRPGMHVEDLYIRPEYRGRGLGRRFISELARIAADRGFGRMEWTVLDWNERARRLYQRLGAAEKKAWIICRLDEAGIARLAESEPPLAAATE